MIFLTAIANRVRRPGLISLLVGFLALTFLLFIITGYFLAKSLSDSFVDSSLDEISSVSATSLQLRAIPVISPTYTLSTPKYANTDAEKSFSKLAYAMVQGAPIYYVKFWSPSGQLVWRDRNQQNIGQSDAQNTMLQTALGGHRAYALHTLDEAQPMADAVGIDALLDIYVPLYPIGGAAQPVGVVEVAQDVSGLYANLQVNRGQVYFTIIVATVLLYYVLVVVVITASRLVRRYQRREQYRESRLLELRRQFSPAVADAIIALGDRDSLSKGLTARVEASVLFVDIRNFTNQAARMPAEEVVAMLNAYMDTGTRVVFSYDGVVDKFLGDGILAVFGVPSRQPDHALRAAVAALSLRRELTKLNNTRLAEGKPIITVGMGIASGPVVAGNIGSSTQLTYTVIGDAVNLASRLVGMATVDEILIHESTVRAVGGKLAVDGGELVAVRGRDEAVRVYRLLDQPLTPLLADAIGLRPSTNGSTQALPSEISEKPLDAGAIRR